MCQHGLEFDAYAWYEWQSHCLRAHTSLGSRLLSALEDFDITGYLNVAVRRNASVEECISSFRKCLDNLSYVAHWVKDVSLSSPFWSNICIGSDAAVLIRRVAVIRSGNIDGNSIDWSNNIPCLSEDSD